MTIEAAFPGGASASAFSCAYQFANSDVAVLSVGGSREVAPKGSTQPILASSHGDFAQVTVDLRHIRALDRALFILHVNSPEPRDWSGVIRVTTYTGARIEAPLEVRGLHRAVAALSVYQVRGEIVVRVEMDPAASLRDAVQAYGFDAISWLDADTPLT